jgi:uncharacterized membrane protein HdeD (DUF308 family)
MPTVHYGVAMGVRGALAALIVAVGVIAIIAGVIYFTVPAHSLPSFFPGHIAGAPAKHSTRGVAGVLLGVVLVVLGVILGRAGRNPYPHR